MPHLVATLIYLLQIYSYYIRGDRSPLTHWDRFFQMQMNTDAALEVMVTTLTAPGQFLA